MTSSKKILPARKRTLWPVWVAVIVLALAGGGAAWYFFWGPGAARAQSSAVAGAETYTTAVKRGDLSVSASGSGKLVAYQSVDLSFSTSGTVARLNVRLGDTVKAGQELASLNGSNTLEANLAAAELQVLNAQKTLTDLQSGASLSLAQAYSDLLTAQDTYDTALTKSQKVNTTRCSKDVTKRYSAALDSATKNLANIHAEKPGSDAYIAAKKQYDTALANYTYCAGYTDDEKTAAQSGLDVAKNAVQDAQDRYNRLKAASGIDPNELAMDEAKLKEAQAQLANANDKLAGITLTSPIDGKVTSLAAAAGEIVGTGTFITISDVNHPTLDISVDESDLDKLVVGSAVTVSFDALPNQTFTGKVTQVDPQITTSGQYRVANGQVQLDESAVKTVSTLPLGLSATVKVVNKEAKNALLAPAIALKDLGDNTYGVMVKSSGGSGASTGSSASQGQFKLQIVTIGIQDNDYVEITGGLKEGDLVSTGTVKFIAAGSSDNSSSLKNSQNSGGFPGGPPAP